MKVLIVDDDPAMTDLIKLLLAPAQYEVLTTNNGQDGINLAKKFDPDIVLLDLMMPGMTGSQVCQKIRAFSSVPIIMMSALDNPSLVVDALDAGADDYLIKPVPNRVLTAQLEKLARRRRVEATTIAASAGSAS
ncbi:MAG TPA: response regulator transcription factor [Anaerolineaceae bacterium]